MIQYLIAGEAALPLASNRQDFSQIGHVEVADTPRENLAGALEIVKTRVIFQAFLILGFCRLGRIGYLPKVRGCDKRINPLVLPPGAFVAIAMKFLMVLAAKGHCKFVANLSS